ncbi:hypothetical protein, partial [Vibrio cyclitrophicus]|uniref:hypothetical protein n=1 Tax=Vibrio cyclitrophicus TaxID=47951 RepID=UPI000492A097
KAHDSKLRKWAKYGLHDDIQNKQVDNMYTSSYWQQCFYDLQLVFGQKSFSQNHTLAIHE